MQYVYSTAPAEWAKYVWEGKVICNELRKWQGFDNTY